MDSHQHIESSSSNERRYHPTGKERTDTKEPKPEPLASSVSKGPRVEEPTETEQPGDAGENPGKCDVMEPEKGECFQKEEVVNCVECHIDHCSLLEEDREVGCLLVIFTRIVSME